MSLISGATSTDHRPAGRTSLPWDGSGSHRQSFKSPQEPGPARKLASHKLIKANASKAEIKRKARKNFFVLCTDSCRWRQNSARVRDFQWGQQLQNRPGGFSVLTTLSSWPAEAVGIHAHVGCQSEVIVRSHSEIPPVLLASQAALAPHRSHVSERLSRRGPSTGPLQPPGSGQWQWRLTHNLEPLEATSKPLPVLLTEEAAAFTRDAESRLRVAPWYFSFLFNKRGSWWLSEVLFYAAVL